MSLTIQGVSPTETGQRISNKFGINYMSVVGEIVVPHWRTVVGQEDIRHEPVTHWHRLVQTSMVKNLNNPRFEEPIRINGKLHINDVYDKDTNTFIEVQHSKMAPKEQRERSEHYSSLGKLCWLYSWKGHRPNQLVTPDGTWNANNAWNETLDCGVFFRYSKIPSLLFNCTEDGTNTWKGHNIKQFVSKWIEDYNIYWHWDDLDFCFDTNTDLSELDYATYFKAEQVYDRRSAIKAIAQMYKNKDPSYYWESDLQQSYSYVVRVRPIFGIKALLDDMTANSDIWDKRPLNNITENTS